MVDIGDGVSLQSSSASCKGVATELAQRGTTCQVAGFKTSQVIELMQKVAKEEQFVSRHACHF